MGLLGNLFGQYLGAGAGVAGAHNAHLAELVVKGLPEHEKKRVATKVIEMAVKASRNRVPAEEFCAMFNRQERINQLNFIALACAELNIHVISNDSWMPVDNPFMVVVSTKDIEVNAVYLSKKHNINITIGNEKIDIMKWIS